MAFDYKKIGIFALILVAAGVIVFLIYFFFFRPIFITEKPTANENVNTNTNGQLPTLGNINGRLVVLDNNSRLPLGANLNGLPNEITKPTDTASGTLAKTSEVTKDPSLYLGNNAGATTFYDPKTQKFYRILPNGQIEEMSSQKFYNVSNVTWSHELNKAIIEYPDGNKIIYDFQTKKQISLPKHWTDFSFSTSDQNLVFKSIGLDVENRFLTVANIDGSGARAIEDIGGVENRFDPAWSPNNQVIALFHDGLDINRSEVFLIGLNKENFKSMTVEGYGFSGIWSPSGDKILYSVYDQNNDYKPQLWISDGQPGTVGQNRININLETWVEKCTFGTNDKIFCAVPSSLGYGAGLNMESAQDIPDQIFEIDLKTGTKKLLAIPESEHTIDRIIFLNNQLLFTDNETQKIYRINL